MRDDGSENINALTRALARGVATNLIGFAIRSILVFVHSFLAVRLYGAEFYGVYAIGIAVVSLLSFIGQLGLARTVTRFVALHQARNEPKHIVGTLQLVLRISMPVSIGIALALAIGAEPLANLFGEPVLVSSCFRVLALAVPALTLATILSAFTEGFKQMRYRVIALDIVRPGVELLGLVMLFCLGARHLGLPVAYTLSVVLSGGLLICYAKLHLRRLVEAVATPASVSPVTPLKPLLGFAVPVLAVDVLMIATQRAGVLMLGMLGTSAMVGVLSILRQMVGIGMIFVMAMNFMFGPMVAELVEGRRFDELSYLYKVSTRWMLAATMPFFLVLGFFGAEILQIFGREFVGGSGVLWYLIAAAIFTVSVGVCGVILMMSGRPQYSVANEAIVLTTVVGLSLLFIPRYGLRGAVWASVAGAVLVNTLRVFQVWWHLRVHPYSWSLLKVAVAGVTMTAVLWIWKAYALQGRGVWYLLMLGSGIALLAYGVVLVTLGLDGTEMAMLRSLQSRAGRLRAIPVQSCRRQDTEASK